MSYPPAHDPYPADDRYPVYPPGTPAPPAGAGPNPSSASPAVTPSEYLIAPAAGATNPSPAVPASPAATPSEYLIAPAAGATNSLAVTSLVLGALAFVMAVALFTIAGTLLRRFVPLSGFTLPASLVAPLLLAIVAIILGHVARSQIKRSGGATRGQGLALTGLILGYVFVAVFIVGFALLILTLIVVFRNFS